MTRPDREMSTLFDREWFGTSNRDPDHSYPLCLEYRQNDDEPGVDENELSAFAHVIEHETECYEPRGYLSGPVEIVTHYPDTTAGRVCRASNSIMLPTIADAPYVEIINCRATGLLLVDNAVVYDGLVTSPAFQELGLLLINGCGVPRLTARKLIHRLNVEEGVRVHLLTDNDTWGYFMFSLLLRGAMAPHAYFPWAAVDQVNLLGVRAGDVERFNVPDKYRRNWKNIWTPRLNALRGYECFQTDEWQEELKRFEEQNYAVSLWDFVEAMGSADVFVADFLIPRLDGK